ncbi:penicillin-binding protein activator LpoB [Nitrospira sp. M1]
MTKLFWMVFAIGLLTVMTHGCTVIDYSRDPMLDAHAPWVLLPIVNHTETPQAGRRAEAITESLLYSQGMTQIRRYPSALQDGSFILGSDNTLYESALHWAKEQKARYAITGTVDEWRYKVGIDGEPAVGVSLRILDLQTNHVVWSAVGGQTGWSREAVSAVAQKLIKRLLKEVSVS